MHKNRLKSHALWLALALALVFITNPELRALLLLAEFMDAEIFALSLWIYFRAFWPIALQQVDDACQRMLPPLRRALRFGRMALLGLFPREGSRMIIDHLFQTLGTSGKRLNI